MVEYLRNNNSPTPFYRDGIGHGTGKETGTVMAPRKSNESTEDYLETILILSGRLPVVRSVDISNEMGYRKSSVSVAMKNLREKNLITMADSGYIYLTEEGKKIAQSVYERHEFLSCWLQKLGVAVEVSELDACRIEHVISSDSFEAIKEFIRVHECDNCIKKDKNHS